MKSTTGTDDVTHLFETYRECVRHLWNTYFRPMAEPPQEWDVRDEFDEIARSLFHSLVSHPLDLYEIELSPAYSAVRTPQPAFLIVPNVASGVPISINRQNPRCPYWDHPVNRVNTNDVELHFVHYFDFDEIGYRDFQYFEVFINASPTYPDIVGRTALIEVKFAKALHTDFS